MDTENESSRTHWSNSSHPAEEFAERIGTTFRHGAIAASVFRRINSTGIPFMDISLSRTWKNQRTGKEGYSHELLCTQRRPAKSRH